MSSATYVSIQRLRSAPAFRYGMIGVESPLYKRDVDPTAKCPVFVRQVVAVESQQVEDELAEASILVPFAKRLVPRRRSTNEEIYREEDEDEDRLN